MIPEFSNHLKRLPRELDYWVLDSWKELIPPSMLTNKNKLGKTNQAA